MSAKFLIENTGLLLSSLSLLILKRGQNEEGGTINVYLKFIAGNILQTYKDVLVRSV